ncbi:MAG: ABC transporter permease subunit [Eubacteriales bacterium]|nr:ABC transporter permease subunit [Eubacteriales bacterium]
MYVNPIIEKELKVKMRGWKSPAVICGYIAFLGLVLFLYFLFTSQMYSYGQSYFNPSVAVGSFNTLALVQFIMILLITPALTAPAISGERERQTLDLLLCTTLKPISIIFGKVVASSAHILLLLTASLPVMGVVLMFGGIGIGDLLKLLMFYLITAFMMACMGVFYSTIFKKSVISVVMSYITLFCISAIPLFLYFLYLLVFGINMSGAPSIWQALLIFVPNPIFGYLSMMEGSFNIATEIINALRQGIVSGFQTLLISLIWVMNILFNLLLSAFFLFVASKRLNPIKSRERRRKK